MISRRLQREVARGTDRQSDRIRAALPPLLHATVSAVSPGEAADGNALVSITYRGAEITVAGYAASYTPGVNHRVLCVLVDHQPVIVCRVVGHP